MNSPSLPHGCVLSHGGSSDNWVSVGNVSMGNGTSSASAPGLAWLTRSDCMVCLVPISLFLPILSLV